MSLDEAIRRRGLLRRAASLGAGMVLSQAGLLVPAAYAGERASVLQEDLEKMLSDEPGKVEQARQRIYSDLASAETLAA